MGSVVDKSSIVEQPFTPVMQSHLSSKENDYSSFKKSSIKNNQISRPSHDSIKSYNKMNESENRPQSTHSEAQAQIIVASQGPIESSTLTQQQNATAIIQQDGSKKYIEI